MTQIYEKWRDLSVDPYEIPFKKIEIEKIISYPPAQNDVMECICKYNNQSINAIIKYERSKMADFISECNSLNFLENNGYNFIPKVIEEGIYNEKKFIVLTKLNGERISDIIKNGINDTEKEEYLLCYGKALALVHNIKPINNNIAKQRIINEYPKESVYPEIPENLYKYITYLKENDPEKSFDTFIHGDFHYANILWEEKRISGILDWEYSGLGFKEQDIAWALILRPMQEFMDNVEDINNFLKGYKKVGKYNKEYLKWCFINGCCHFYLMNKNNKLYNDKLENLLELIYSNNFDK